MVAQNAIFYGRVGLGKRGPHDCCAVGNSFGSSVAMLKFAGDIETVVSRDSNFSPG
jgi:hypothetical protein